MFRDIRTYGFREDYYTKARQKGVMFARYEEDRKPELSQNRNASNGLLTPGCHLGDCHYNEGNLKAEKRAHAIKLMVKDFGLEAERLRLE